MILLFTRIECVGNLLSHCCAEIVSFLINYWCGPVLHAIVVLYGLEQRSVSSPNIYGYVLNHSLCLFAFGFSKSLSLMS